MKKITILLCMAFASIFVGCKANGYTPPKNVIESFNNKYTQATRVNWEIRNSYYVAEFILNNTKSEAWFDNKGEWSMTESELSFRQLPVVIRNGFDASEFKNWAIEDVEKVERNGMESLYILQVELGEQEMAIHYLENGTRIKTVMHDPHEHQPMNLPENVKQFLQQKYPQANIIEVEEDNSLLKIDIVDNRIKKEVVFNYKNQWVATNWEVLRNEVPAKVMQALQASAYAQYQIDDIDYEEQADGTNLYIFNLESGHQEVILYINANSAQIISAIQEH